MVDLEANNHKKPNYTRVLAYFYPCLNLSGSVILIFKMMNLLPCTSLFSELRLERDRRDWPYLFS